MFFDRFYRSMNGTKRFLRALTAIDDRNLTVIVANY